ncbi:hypothetical protein VVD49_02850 [Uliginosibacterium sp. H3]|uniref:Lipoprotein n=1 Tax=Uliginosibacterium silvisoli TaxID=3114758 RepID=A0ABU6JYY8_9RHOO|nr:hypothetical protein [Uliginosibacterium sp. H3]
MNLRSLAVSLVIGAVMSGCAISTNTIRGRYLQTGPEDAVTSEIEIDGFAGDTTESCQALLMSFPSNVRRISRCMEASVNLPYIGKVAYPFYNATVIVSGNTLKFCEEAVNRLRPNKQLKVTQECAKR